jgi:hypothetical protein
LAALRAARTETIHELLRSDSRHVEVEQHHVESLAFGRRQPRLAVGAKYGEVTLELEQQPERLTEGRIIFDD